ncbi:MAG: HAD family phosphatase [Verrucomicrobiota bacterium]|nr:HAD family phosphatase [Verrucomicrobiota bacterium]
MPVPSIVVFDLGKVLVDFDYQIAIQKITARSSVNSCEVQKLIDESPLLCRYETGSITTEMFFDEAQKGSGFSGDLMEFGALFSDIFSPIEPMIEFQAALREQGISTYIFSNTNELAVKHIRERFPFFKTFSDYIFSYEHGAMKPDEKLYRVVEKISGCRGEEILYLDDRAENIEAGKKLGWQTVWHQTPAKTLRSVFESGLRWNGTPSNGI